MDPVSALATASAAFSALKKGFAIGRDLESMASDLSRWMGALSDLEQAEKESRNPPIFRRLFAGSSVEQEAANVWAAKRKATAQRDELRQWVQLTLGQKAWTDLVAEEGRIRKRRQETLYRQRERRRKFVEIVAWTIMIGAGLAVLTSFVLLLKTHTARAGDPEYVTCRLVGCEVIDKERICIYRGPNFTQNVLHLRRGEWYPTEFQCKYKPNVERPPTVREVLKAIKEKMS